MHKLFMPVLLAALISGCSKGGDTANEVLVAPGTMSSSAALEPGLAETQKICMQCHFMPSPGQHHPAAWPSIVAKMESYMRANKRLLPTDKEREAIIGYLQSGWQK